MVETSCKTKYPILLVHGTGFRDRKRLGYWGRIPRALEERGAQIFYGHQDSWGTMEYNAQVVGQSLSRTLAETGCDKVNIIAHSKGGLEARYLVSSLGYADRVASITTISTPHHGSKTMDLLLRLPSLLFGLIAAFVNPYFRILGDSHPDFHTTCRQFSTSYLAAFNRENPDQKEVYYQSYATVMRHSGSDIIMWLPHLITSRIEGENDGLVSSASATWTNFRGVWHSGARRGISHPDAVDLRRRNFTKKTDVSGIADIREGYIGIVKNLKEMGF